MNWPDSRIVLIQFHRTFSHQLLLWWDRIKKFYSSPRGLLVNRLSQQANLTCNSTKKPCCLWDWVVLGWSCAINMRTGKIKFIFWCEGPCTSAKSNETSNERSWETRHGSCHALMSFCGKVFAFMVQSSTKYVQSNQFKFSAYKFFSRHLRKVFRLQQISFSP